MSIFTKTKNFFNRQYWYNNRRSKSVGKASFVLDDTWDGLHSMIDYMVLKVEHMFHDTKNYCDVEKSYVDSSILIKHGTKKDKEYFFNKLFNDNFEKLFIINAHIDKNDSVDGLLGYYLCREINEQEDSTFTYHILRRYAISAKVDNTRTRIISLNPLETGPAYNYEYRYAKIAHFDSFALLKKEDISFIENTIKNDVLRYDDATLEDFNLVDKILLAQGHFLVRGQVFKNISDKLKNKVVGRNKKLLTFCKLRKLLKNANYSMEDYLDSIDFYESLETGKKAIGDFENSQAEFKKELRKRLNIVTDFIVENYENLF